MTFSSVNPELWVTTLIRLTRFSCSYQNLADTAGSAAGQNWGLELTLQIQVSGEVEPKTGMIINLRDLDRCLATVIAPIRDRHLNDLPYFAGRSLAPTLERLATLLFQNLNLELAMVEDKVRTPSGGFCRLERLTLVENEGLSVEVGC